MKNKEIISRERSQKRTGHIYYLENYVSLEESEKGRSRQTGKTKNKIIKLLSKRTLTTIELSKRLQLERNSLMPILRKLEKQNKIIRTGKIHTGAQPTIIWEKQMINNGL